MKVLALAKNTARAVAVAALLGGQAIAVLWVASAALAQEGAAPDNLDADLIATRRIISAFACTVPGYTQVTRARRSGAQTTSTIRPQIDTTLGAMALAERPAGGDTLFIWANPYLLMRFAPITQVFWLAHECAHHTLAHTQSRGVVTDTCVGYRESAADCEAIRMMQDGSKSLVDADALLVIESELRTKLKAKDPGGIYLGGPARADVVDQCARDAAYGQSVIALGQCEGSPRHGP